MSLLNVAAVLTLGVVLGLASVRLVSPILEAPVFARTNYRGAPLAVGSGLVLVVATLVAGALHSIVQQIPSQIGDGTKDSLLIALANGGGLIAAVIGFAALGLVDDLAAVGTDRGFRGHLRALRRGRLTTGALKLFGGTFFALFIAGDMTRSKSAGVLWLLVNGALIALGANLVNLLDRGPGRALKVSMLSIMGVVVALAILGGHGSVTYAPLIFTVGVALAMIRDDLAERSMLGDTGANPLGAVVGVSLTALPTAGRVGGLVLLLFLNLASEKVSFSAVIDRTGPLRWLDRLGTGHHRKMS
jgi:UDP-GlcNAc:undecaprenyl-phosphate/decaprenyl-phosphate GlcNAc-1-phosphate transferase